VGTTKFRKNAAASHELAAFFISGLLQQSIKEQSSDSY
jgi:hypothetical protein